LHLARRFAVHYQRRERAIGVLMAPARFREDLAGGTVTAQSRPSSRSSAQFAGKVGGLEMSTDRRPSSAGEQAARAMIARAVRYFMVFSFGWRSWLTFDAERQGGAVERVGLNGTLGRV